MQHEPERETVGEASHPTEPPFVGALLRLCWQRVRTHLQEAVRGAGFMDLQDAHFAVFSYPLPDAVRLSDMARQLRMSRQAAHYLVGQLEQLGYLERRAAPGSDRRLIYTWPLKKSVTSIKRKVKAATKQITHQPADELFLRLTRMTRGWAQYFRHGSSSKAYHDLQNYLWWRTWSWLTHKHPRTPKRTIIRRYFNGWQPEYNGVSLYQPTTMTIQRYRYRGKRIPTPWDKPATVALA